MNSEYELIKILTYGTKCVLHVGEIDRCKEAQQRSYVPTFNGVSGSQHCDQIQTT